MTIARDNQQHIPPSVLRHRLRDAREWRGLEQIDLAIELGIGRSTVSNYERGITEPGKLVVNAWAVITNTDVEWLKTGETGGTHGPNGGRLGESNSRPSHYNVVSLFRELVAA